ncbi:hypothetical protein HZA57_06390, partial [Candidatus Poribacteria bacterium]|nr:hypothetical protein [Candidatus Poribacteria bacterium]
MGRNRFFSRFGFKRLSLTAGALVLALGGTVVRADADVTGDGVVDAADAIRVQVEGADPEITGERLDELDLNQSGHANEDDAELAANVMLGKTIIFPLDLDMTAPAETYTVTSQTAVTVSGTVSEAADVRVADLVFENITGPFTTTYFLTPGSNIITVEANRVGEDFPVSRQSREVLLDINPPALTITEPATMVSMPGLTTRVAGRVSDLTPVTIEVETPVGVFETQPDIFGDWSLEADLIDGLNTITVTATDAAGLTNQGALMVRSFMSPEQTVTSPEGAAIQLPEGAFPMEEMVVRMHDLDTAEAEAILGIDLQNTPPINGLDGLTEGVIIMPNAMMVEVESGPENGEPLFREDVGITLPNVTGATNAMPIWIFQIQPDIDGDGEPQLCVVSRGKVSDVGTVVEPLVDGTGEVDAFLPGFMSPSNNRFQETDLEQVSAARAVRDLKKRLRGEAPIPMSGPGVGLARRPVDGQLERAAERGAAKPEPVAEMLPPPVPQESSSSVTPMWSSRQGGLYLLVDDFEDIIGDNDLLNLLMPPGISFVTETYEPHPTNPIREIPLDAEDLIEQGWPAKRKPMGVNGGIHLLGSYGLSEDPGEAFINCVLLGQETGLNLSGIDELALCFDARGAGADTKFEVTVFDSFGPGAYIEFQPLPDWKEFRIPLVEFAGFGDGLNFGDIRRIQWRLTGPKGTTFDIQIDNPAFCAPGGSPPATPTPRPSPTPTLVDPTPPPVTPSPTPFPTATPPFVTTNTPGPSPTPTPGGVTTPPPTDTPIATVTPQGEREPTGQQGKTQVTFYCCAASALIPYTGKTKCDDDQNVDQQRLRDCIAEKQRQLNACNAEVERLLKEIDRLVGGMEKGYYTLFGSPVEVNGVKVPTIVGGSIFKSLPLISGASKGADLTKKILSVAGDGISSVNDIRQAVDSGTAEDITGASVNTTSRILNNTVSFLAKSPNEDGSLTSQLQARSGFKNALKATSIISNIYKTYKGALGYIEGYYLVEPLSRSLELEINRCARIFRDLQNLKNCEKGSNAFRNCTEDPGRDVYLWEGNADPKVADLARRVRETRERAETVANSFLKLQGHIENYHSFLILLGEACELSVDIEVNGSSMSDEELRTKGEQLAEFLRFSMESLQEYGENAETVDAGLLDATDGLDAALAMAMASQEVGELSDKFLADDAVSDQGDAGVLLNIEGQPGSAMIRSGKGGRFVGYRYASAGRVGDTVTFDGE